MSENEPDQVFWEIADSFIHLANESCDEHPRGKVSAAFLYAVARFNTFVVAARIADKEAFVRERDEAISYFTRQFEMMLRENLEEYAKNYEKYFSAR